MRVVFTAELDLVLDNDDSAESFRHDLEHRLRQEWISDRREGEVITVRVRSITADVDEDPLDEGRFRALRNSVGGIQAGGD